MPKFTLEQARQYLSTHAYQEDMWGHKRYCIQIDYDKLIEIDEFDHTNFYYDLTAIAHVEDIDVQHSMVLGAHPSVAMIELDIEWESSAAEETEVDIIPLAAELAQIRQEIIDLANEYGYEGFLMERPNA